MSEMSGLRFRDGSLIWAIDPRQFVFAFGAWVDAMETRKRLWALQG